MKILLFALVLSSNLCLAEALKMEPGLWTVEMKMKGPDGKEVNPMAAVKEAMAQMTPEQRKEMEKMMGKMNGGSLEKDDIQVCYTKEMLQSPDSVANHDQENCKTKVLSSSPSKIKTKFTCKDGTRGDAIWSVKDAKSYEGSVNAETPEHGKTSVSYTGKFVSKDCGKVKPFSSQTNLK